MYELIMDPGPEEVLCRIKMTHVSNEYYQTGTDHMLMKCSKKSILNLNTWEGLSEANDRTLGLRKKGGET